MTCQQWRDHKILIIQWEKTRKLCILSPGYDSDGISVDDADIWIARLRWVSLELSRQIIRRQHILHEVTAVFWYSDFIHDGYRHAQIPSCRNKTPKCDPINTEHQEGMNNHQLCFKWTGVCVCVYLLSFLYRWSAWVSWSHWRCSAHTVRLLYWHMPTFLQDTLSPRTTLRRAAQAHNILSDASETQPAMNDKDNNETSFCRDDVKCGRAMSYLVKGLCKKKD